MLRVPRREEVRAWGVGRQMWRWEEMTVRNGVVGVQWAGREGVRRFCIEGGISLSLFVYTV